MAKINLTDRTLKSLKPTGKQYDVMDLSVPGFGVRVTGVVTFILFTRFPGSSNPTRRAIGQYPAISLETARQRAREWRDLIRRGIDPKDYEAELKRAELRKSATTFGAVAEAYLAAEVSKQRRQHRTESEIRKDLIPAWGERPITAITRSDVVALIKAIVARGAPGTARLVLCHARLIFSWAIHEDTYGLESSPCSMIAPTKVIGEKPIRMRVLTNEELARLWVATEKEGYPFGPLYRLLILTGARLSEVAQARWGEFDLAAKVWTVPAERFKSEAPHRVPLSDAAIVVLESLPHRGDYLFTTTGRSPVSNFGPVKDRLDKVVGASDWVNHDIRRTLRTGLAKLKVQDHVAEMVLGHAKRGLQRVYDQHGYEDEMREALELWAARLRSIVTPTPANVNEMAKRFAPQVA
jgi:integrase